MKQNKDLTKIIDLESEIVKEAEKDIKPNYMLADLLRENLRRKGWTVIDTPNGTKLKRI